MNARIYYDGGQQHPYDRDDEDNAPHGDWAVKAVRGVINNLRDRRDIKRGFERVDTEVRQEIVETLAAIVRIAASEGTPTIRQFLDTSTYHLSDETREWLSGQAAMNSDIHGPNWHVAEHHDGWWCRVPVDYAPEDFPADLLLVCDRARTLGAAYILFDRDAAPIEDLPIYEH